MIFMFCILNISSQNADLTNANLENAILEGANLKVNVCCIYDGLGKNSYGNGFFLTLFLGCGESGHLCPVDSNVHLVEKTGI